MTLQNQELGSADEKDKFHISTQPHALKRLLKQRRRPKEKQEFSIYSAQ